MKIQKGSRVLLGGKAGRFAFAIETLAGKIAYVDFKTPAGNEYFKICMFNELKIKTRR